MITWMKHEDHGVMPCYDLQTVKENEKVGWKKMTKAEIEKVSPKKIETEE